VGEKYAHTSGKYFGVEWGTSIDAVEIVAVLEQDTLAAMLAGKRIVAVSTLVGVEDKRTARTDTSKKSTVAGGNLDVVAILMGSSVHRGRSKSERKAVGMFVRTVGVDYDQARLRMDSRMPGLVAKNRPQCGVMENSRILCYPAGRRRRRKGCNRDWAALVANAKV